MKKKDIHLCKNCKHCIEVKDKNYYYCMANYKPHLDVVTGKISYHAPKSCHATRLSKTCVWYEEGECKEIDMSILDYVKQFDYDDYSI